MPENNAKSIAPNERVYGAGHRLIGKNYVTADLYAKVTGQAKYRGGLSRRRNAFLQVAPQSLAARAREASRRSASASNAAA